MNAEDIPPLYDFNSWANHRRLDSCAALSNEQFTRDLGSSFKSVRDTLVHIYRRRVGVARALAWTLANELAAGAGFSRSCVRARTLGGSRS